MNLEALNSTEFQNDLVNTIQQINKKYNLSIKCSQISCGSDLLTIYVEDSVENN